MAERIHEELGWGTNVLLTGPTLHTTARDTCVDLLAPTSASELDVLWVAYTGSMADRIEDWQANTDGSASRLTVFGLGEGQGAAIEGEASVRQVGTPADLTGLGIAIRDHLESPAGRVVVCFHSLTSLLQYVDLETAYEFLHVLTGQLYTADALAHFHLDPDAHDEQTVTTLTSLFDAVVAVEEEGTRIRTRPTFER